MIAKYEKLDSKFNVYPFKTCPLCGLTFAIMGENPPRLPRKDKTKTPKVEQIQIAGLIESEEENSSLMINIDSVDDYVTDELIDESDEFLLAEMLDTVNYEKKCYNEKFEHSLYCARFKAAKKKYEPYLLTYQERQYITSKLLPLLSKNQAFSTKEILIKHICEIAFTESLEMIDFSLSHPKFPEFMNLLWSTPWFLKEMEKYLTQEDLSKFRSKHPKNGGLRKNLKWWSADKSVGEDYADNEEDCFENFKPATEEFLGDEDIGDFFDE